MTPATILLTLLTSVSTAAIITLSMIAVLMFLLVIFRIQTDPKTDRLIGTVSVITMIAGFFAIVLLIIYPPHEEALRRGNLIGVVIPPGFIFAWLLASTVRWARGQ